MRKIPHIFLPLCLIALALGCEPPNSLPKPEQVSERARPASARPVPTQPAPMPPAPAQPDPAHPAHTADAPFTEQDYLGLLVNDSPYQQQALHKLEHHASPDFVPILIDLTEFNKEQTPELITSLLERLSQQKFGKDWFAWREWQDRQKLESNPYYILFKTFLLQRYDPDYTAYIYPGLLHTVPLDEIRFGGVYQNSMIPLFNPRHIPAADAAYLADDAAVLGLEINGETRAYPLVLLEIHQAVNDLLGGKPLALTYSPISGSPACFAADLGTSGVLALQSLGLLRKGNDLFFDNLTRSVWPNLDPRPVIGTLTAQNISLSLYPLARCSWAEWRQLHPDTTVLSPPALTRIQYPQERIFALYENSPELKFPVGLTNAALPAKEWVCGIELNGAHKAWPLKLFAGHPVLNDSLGDQPLVLLGNATEKTARIYLRGEQEFALNDAGELIDKRTNAVWQRSESALTGKNAAQKLTRIPSSLCYWFAWQGLYPETAVGNGKK